MQAERIGRFDIFVFSIARFAAASSTAAATSAGSPLTSASVLALTGGKSATAAHAG